MSLSEIQQLEKGACGHEFKYQLGDILFLRSDFKGKYPMIVTDFDYDDESCIDYHVTWFNSQGKQEIGYFPEEALTNKNPKK